MALGKGLTDSGKHEQFGEEIESLWITLSGM